MIRRIRRWRMNFHYYMALWHDKEFESHVAAFHMIAVKAKGEKTH